MSAWVLFFNSEVSHILILLSFQPKRKTLEGFTKILNVKFERKIKRINNDFLICFLKLEEFLNDKKSMIWKMI